MSVIKILVVDDFAPWHCFVQTVFETEPDLKISAAATNGLEAIHRVKDCQPDLVLMDLCMPSMNGLECVRQIRAVSPCSKVLFVSGHGDPELIRAALEAGASGYVLKTDSVNDLISGVRAVLEGREFVSRSLANWQKNLDGSGSKRVGPDTNGPGPE